VSLLRWGLALALLSALPQRLWAAPALRYQVDTPGGYAVIGQTLAYDCGSAQPAPAGSTVTCTGIGDGDSAPDLYWRDDVASPATSATSGRSAARLTLPAGATVTYARLYWAALRANDLPDQEVTFDRDGGFSATVRAEASGSKVVLTSGPVMGVIYVAYQASADVTALVQASGEGLYRVTDVDSITLTGNGALSENPFSAWHLVVIYSLPAGATQHIAVYDGLDGVDQNTEAAALVDGFTVPAGGSPQASLAAWAFETDASQTGDALKINGTAVGNAANPADNFWNESHTRAGAGVTGQSPALTGLPATGAGSDLDEIDLAPLLSGGATSFRLAATATTDTFWFGGFVLALATDGPPPGLDAGAPGADAGGSDGGSDGGNSGNPEAGTSSDGGPGGDGGPSTGDGGVADAPAGGSTDAGGTDGPARDGSGGGSTIDDSVVAEGSGCRCALGTSGDGPTAALLPWALAYALFQLRARRRRR
jgi:uncharacterized protein (TIGR03382 family)